MDQVLHRANEIKKVRVTELKPHPKNMNRHSIDQINRLADIIRYQGFRNPVVVSNLSGLVVQGHGRIEAAKKLKMEFVPVIYQDFDDETQEYSALVADNSIASWAELDLAMINAELPELGPDFDIDLLGLKDFELEPMDKFDEPAEKKSPEDKDANLIECPNCGCMI